MKCKNCHAENPDDALNCKKCGAALDEDTRPNADKGIETVVLDEKTRLIPDRGMETVILDSSTRLNVDPLGFGPGEKFGTRYQIIEEIGQGGMGRVFKAKDLELNTVVALKMIKPQLSTDPDIIARFKRELLLAREILHEHVIRIHDLGEINGIKYISMNYIQGNTLKEILQTTGKLTIEKTLDILKQVCSALITAHSKGIIHRDLKPQNIMIDKNGKAYVLDFGIARSLHWEGEAAEEEFVMGTPDFMSPEQIKGEKADASTDIYSLGIILYEMITGKLPFTASSHRELLYQHMNAVPEKPSKWNPQVPFKLERITLKCLEKKKKNRYQSVREVLQDIELDKTQEIPPVLPKSKKERRFFKSFFKTTLWAFILILIVYAAVSISSLVNDSLYKTKIEKLRVEYDSYYKNYFPLKKDWLPQQWTGKECNSWDTYIKLFPEKPANTPPDLPTEKINETVRDFRYDTVWELKSLIAAYGQYVKYDLLVEGLKCSKLDSYIVWGKPQRLDLPGIHRYAGMISAAARVDFWEGNYEAGFTKLYHGMLFALDLFSGSTHLQEQEMALGFFKQMCWEMIPVLLSYDMDIDALPPHQSGCLAAFGNFKSRLFPFSYHRPPRELENESTGRLFTRFPILHSIELLIRTALTKFEPQTIFYKEYLNLVKNYEDLYATMGMTPSDYRWYRKLEFWEQWFSINRFFYKEGIEFYRGLFDGMKYIRDMHDKSIYINDYFKKINAGGSGNLLITKGYQSASTLTVSRTFGKVVLILFTVHSYGPDSKEFLNLKGTNGFINELTGNTFEIAGAGENCSIVLDKNLNLDLKKIDYVEGHKKILRSFQSFQH